jgi:hypothetical protein
MSFGDMITRSLIDIAVLTGRVLLGGTMAGIGAARQHHANKAMQYAPKSLHASGQRNLFEMMLATFEITLPRNMQWDIEAAQRLVSHLGHMGDFLVEVLADRSGIKWRITLWVDESFEERELEEAIAAYYPQATVTLVSYQEDWDGVPKVRLITPYAMAAIYPAPIYTVDQVKHFDPLAPITAAMTGLNAGERVRISTYITRAPAMAAEKGHQLLTGSDLSWFHYLTLDGALYEEVRRRAGHDRHNRYAPQLDRVMREKLSSQLYHAVSLLEVQADNRTRTQQLHDQMLPYIAHYANPPFNSIEPLVATDDMLDIHTENDYYQFVPPSIIGGIAAGEFELNQWHTMLLVLSEPEIAALWHLPHDGLTAAGIQWGTGIYTPLPSPLRQLTAADGIPVGICRWGREQAEVYLPHENLTMHTLIAGKNGTGKSSLMHHHIRAQIASGRGLILIDPKGPLASAVMQHSIASGREGDLVCLDTGYQVDGVWYPPPINLLARDPQVDTDVASRRLLDIMSAWYEEFANRQMADTMNMILLALSVVDNPTIADAIKLLEDEAYRDDIIRRLPEDEFVARDFWVDFGLKPAKQQDALAGPIRWRLRSFYNNKWLRAITCHPQPLDLRRLIAQNKIIVVSLHDPTRRLPKNERFLLGAVLISQLDMAVRSGAVTDAPYMLYIDEAQEFVGTDLPEMLSQVRQFGLGMVLANQYFRQLQGDTFDAVEGNISTLISFEVGGRDASTAADYMAPEISKHDLTHLGVYRAATSLRYRGERQPAFVMETLPPPGHETDNPEREAQLRRLSVEGYTPKSYSEVTQWLQERYGNQQQQPAPVNGDGDDFFE